MRLLNTLGTCYGGLRRSSLMFFDLPFSRPHYDDSVHDVITGAKSEWTLLIYLTGVEDGVEGGEVIKQYLPTFWKKVIDLPFL
jgi:hypothetical protein